ncbi:MAG: hypothetical protein J2P50_19205, partial [Hyphomicrobiaceae bacterium]|nr:hypothetical protein [Hyphomicrobiaceae bacterium]
MLKGTAALGAVAIACRRAFTQGAPAAHTAAVGSAAPLPTRGEFLVRGATVITMDPALGDFPAGDVHV